jgi:hypothetical protein
MTQFDHTHLEDHCEPAPAGLWKPIGPWKLVFFHYDYLQDETPDADSVAIWSQLNPTPNPPKPKRRRQARSSSPDRLLTQREAAARIGIAEKTLRGHVDSGALRYVLIGHGTKRPRKMFAASDLQEFIANQTRKDAPVWQSSKTKVRHSGDTTSRSEIIGFTARRSARPSAKRKR